MAVYKPTQCYPYLTAVDMKVGSEPVYFTCKVNTSNKNITGYKVILLDSANNIIFSGGGYNENANPPAFMEKISPLSELTEITVEPNINTGVNDTYIQIPLVQAFNEMLLLSFNCLYYHSDTQTWTDCYNQEVKIKNDGTTYKWKIMLFQGTNGVIINDTTAPYFSNYDNIDVAEYDLVISSGTVCGTTSTRLQIPPSDQVLIQKWVQLAYQDASGYQHVGSRGNIKSYDATLGHIYPVSDWMEAKILNSSRATCCGIYKHSNNADDIPTTDIVKYAFLGSLFGGGAPSGLTTTETWIHDGTTTSTSVTFEKGDLVLLMGQDSSAQYNGVWVADSTTWGRSGNFKDWASYLGRIIYASSSTLGGSTTATAGRNFMSQASYGGTLYTPLLNNLSSSSSLFFTEEQPLVLYPEQLTYTVQYKYNNNITSGSSSPTTVDSYPVNNGDIVLANNGIWQYTSSGWSLLQNVDSSGFYYVTQGEDYGCKTYKGTSTTASYDLCYGKLSYNSQTQTYVSQNVNLEPGQRLFFTNVEDGVLLANGTRQGYITVNSIDKTMWSIAHEELAAPLPSVDPYTYNIQTYFNTSDETAFYAYDAPSLGLNIESTASVDLVATTVEGGTPYIAQLPTYTSSLIDGQAINNNTSALGIANVDGVNTLGVYTASLQEIGDGQSNIPTIDYLYASGSTLQKMPYIVDAYDLYMIANTGIVDGYQLQTNDYIMHQGPAGSGIFQVTALNPFTISRVVDLTTQYPLFVYVKHGNMFGGKFWQIGNQLATITDFVETSMTLDGVAFNQIPANATFYGYYPGAYGPAAGIRKYIKASDGLVPYTDSGEISTNIIAVQQGIQYMDKIVSLTGQQISIVNQTESENAFQITWTPTDSFDEKSAFYIQTGQQYGGRTVTIGTDSNNRKYIQNGLTSIGIDNIYEVTLTNKEGSFSVPVLYKGTINTRFISLMGEYLQPQAASWMSYRWLLADQNGQVIQDTGRHFAGEMKVAFYGLMEKQTYYVALIVEDQLGNSLMSCAEIYADFVAQDLELNFKAQYDCNIHGVVLSVEDMGYILPYQSDTDMVLAYMPADNSLTYRNIQNSNVMRISGSNGSMFANVNGNANENGAKYRYYFGYNETLASIDSKLLTDDDGGTTFRMVTRLDANYRGRILRFAAEVPENNNTKYLAIDIKLPDDFTGSSTRHLDYDTLSNSNLSSNRNTMTATIGYVTNPMDDITTSLITDQLLYTCWVDGSNTYNINSPNIHYYRQFNAQLDSNGDYSGHYTDEYVNVNKITIGARNYRPMDTPFNSDKPINPCCLVIDPTDIVHNGDSIWEDYEVELIPDTYPVQRAEYGRVIPLNGDDPDSHLWNDDISGTTQYWTDYAEGQKPFTMVKRHPPVAFTETGSKIQFRFDIRLCGYDNLGALTTSTTGSTTAFSYNSTNTITITITVQQIVGSNI